jgi:hypothetical protein
LLFSIKSRSTTGVAYVALTLDEGETGAALRTIGK